MKIFSMSLISPTKKSDLEFLTVWADIIEITHRFYRKSPDQKILEYLHGFIATYEELKERIDTHDYTAEDKAYWKFEKLSTGAS